MTNERLVCRLADHFNDAMFVIEPKTGRFLDVNGRACISLGYTRDDLLGMKVGDIEIELSTEEQWEEHTNLMKEKLHMIRPGVHRRKNGTTFPVEVSISYVVIDRSVFMTAIARHLF